MVETAHVKYAYFDVVAFTQGRSVEAQSDVVASINKLTIEALNAIEAPIDRTIFLPTGDGLAIALIDDPTYDSHLRFAIELLARLAQANDDASDEMRQFAIRVGVNENVDNVVEDINGRRNVAGLGISMAQRIMDQADGGQVLVGQTVYETLRQREQYMSKFRAFQATGKHGVSFPVYQFVSGDVSGLNVNVPAAFETAKRPIPKLTKLAAYYIAHGTANRDFLLARRDDPGRDYAAIILLWFLATDSVDKSETPDHDTPTTQTYRAGSATFEDQYAFYLKNDMWLLGNFSRVLAERYLSRYERFFDESFLTNYAFMKPEAVEKLRTDWPTIADEFGL